MSIFDDAIKNFLGPIEDLLEDDSISEIMVNGPFEIYIERSGKIEKTPNSFSSKSNLMAALRAIAQTVGKTFDASAPRLDASLPDGSRIAAVIDPISVGGPSFSIRKFFKDEVKLKDLIDWGALSEDGARFIDICTYLGKNMLVSGGTGSGKTTLLKVIANRIPENQRIIIAEDTKEIELEGKHVVQFLTRKGDENKKLEAVTIRDLLHSAMRLRPDRIVVGEVRGDEALDLINAMNTGHEGSMGTVHANNPSEACLRLETLCLLSGTKIPPQSIKLMIANALHIIVQTKRYSDGKRRVSHISEVLGVSVTGEYKLKNIFEWVQRSKNHETGELIGELCACQVLPSFFDDIRVNKLPFPMSKFEMPGWLKELKVQKFKKAS